MTYDSSLSQTPNSHSICHSHPTRDSLSPPEDGEAWGRRREAECSRHQTPDIASPAGPGSQQKDGCYRWGRQVMPEHAPEPSPPGAPAALLALHRREHGDNTQASSVQGHGLRHQFGKIIWHALLIDQNFNKIFSPRPSASRQIGRRRIQLFKHYPVNFSMPK